MLLDIIKCLRHIEGIKLVTVSIHQPSYLPWPLFFDKFLNCDVFVFLDDVQYEKNGWQNRNLIRTKERPIHLTIPVHSSTKTNLNKIKIDNSKNWKEKHIKSFLINYSNYPFFKLYWNELKKIYEKDYDLLYDINIKIIQFILKKINIKTKSITSSELNIHKQGSDKILEICKILNAEIYFSGRFGINYLKKEEFVKNNIEIKFQKSHLFKYPQKYNPFIENLSTIDLLFNMGPKALSTFKH